jgi:competence protein ComEA
MKIKNKFLALSLMLMLSFILAGKSYALTGVININQATQSELSLLPGVGDAKALKIIEHRNKTQFKKLSDLLEVKGVGEKTLDKWKAYIRFDGETTLKK